MLTKIRNTAQILAAPRRDANQQPENTKGEKLTSRAFKAECLFEWGYLAKKYIVKVGLSKSFQMNLFQNGTS